MEREISLEEIENEDVLKSFKNDGDITVDEIGEFLYRSGVLVKLIIGRLRLKFSFDFKGLGVDFSKTESKDFANGHMENGKISILPVDLEKKLNSIEGSLRNRQKRMATGFENQFMPLDSYVEFKKDFAMTKKEYFALRDEILYKWDSLIVDYKERLKLLLQEVNAIERDKFYNQMIAYIPSKEEYKRSFKMIMSVKTMPQVERNSGLHDEINNIIAKDIVSVIFETVAGCLQKSFKLANSAVNSYKEKLDIPAKTYGAIKRISPTLRTRNVAINNNAVVNEIADLFDEAAKAEDKDEVATICEVILAKSYIYAVDNDLPIKGEPTIKEEDLRMICKFS